MKSAERSSTGRALAALVLVAGNVALSLVLVLGAFAQTQPAVELEGAIAKEQVDGDLKTAISEYQKIASNTAAPRDTRARALIHLASCYEKLGQQAQKVYEQIVRDFADQPVAAQARARLAAYSRHQALPLKELTPIRLTANTSELPVQAAAISPDGKFVAYSDPLGIHVRSTVTGETRLLPETQDQLLLRWMTDSQRVQTQLTDSAGNTTAMVIRSSGGLSQPLTSGPFLPSPDGNHRAIVSPDHLRLSLQDKDGGSPRELWRAAGRHTLDQAEWRPDSKDIAVLSSSKSDADQNPPALELIEIATGKTSLPVPVEGKHSVSSMVWVSQNRLIVSVDEDLGGVNHYGSNLWELRFGSGGSGASGAFRKLTAWADFPIGPGSLSTDGKRLIFVRSFRQRDVYVAPLEVGGTRMGTPRRITLDLGDDYPTAWTADSRTVIFTSDRNGPQGIFRQDLDQQTAEQIVVMPGNQLLARSTPDASSLLFLNYDPAKSRHSQLMRVPVAGGQAELVPNAARVGPNYRCSPAGVCVIAQKQEDDAFVFSELDLVKGKGREIYRDTHAEHLILSPDGKWIADTSGSGPELKVILRSFSTGAVAQQIPISGVTKLTGFDYAPDGAGFFLGDSSPTQVRQLYMDLSGRISVLWHQPRLPGCDCGIWGVPSPNSKYLALMMFTNDANAYMVENF